MFRWEDQISSTKRDESLSAAWFDSYHTVSSPLAPNLKGRPRKKKLSLSQRRESQAQGQGSSGSTQSSAAVGAQEPLSPESKTTTKVRLEEFWKKYTAQIKKWS